MTWVGLRYPKGKRKLCPRHVAARLASFGARVEPRTPRIVPLKIGLIVKVDEKKQVKPPDGRDKRCMAGKGMVESVRGRTGWAEWAGAEPAGAEPAAAEMAGTETAGTETAGTKQTE